MHRRPRFSGKQRGDGADDELVFRVDIEASLDAESDLESPFFASAPGQGGR